MCSLTSLCASFLIGKMGIMIFKVVVKIKSGNTYKCVDLSLTYPENDSDGSISRLDKLEFLAESRCSELGRVGSSLRNGAWPASPPRANLRNHSSPARREVFHGSVVLVGVPACRGPVPRAGRGRLEPRREGVYTRMWTVPPRDPPQLMYLFSCGWILRWFPVWGFMNSGAVNILEHRNAFQLGINYYNYMELTPGNRNQPALFLYKLTFLTGPFHLLDTF